MMGKMLAVKAAAKSEVTKFWVDYESKDNTLVSGRIALSGKSPRFLVCLVSLVSNNAWKEYRLADEMLYFQRSNCLEHFFFKASW